MVANFDDTLVTSGVRHRSVLPFLIFVNEVVKGLSYKILLYADDCMVYSSINISDVSYPQGPELFTAIVQEIKYATKHCQISANVSYLQACTNPPWRIFHIVSNLVKGGTVRFI